MEEEESRRRWSTEVRSVELIRLASRRPTSLTLPYSRFPRPFVLFLPSLQPSSSKHLRSTHPIQSSLPPRSRLGLPNPTLASPSQNNDDERRRTHTPTNSYALSLSPPSKHTISFSSPRLTIFHLSFSHSLLRFLLASSSPSRSFVPSSSFACTPFVGSFLAFASSKPNTYPHTPHAYTPVSFSFPSFPVIFALPLEMIHALSTLLFFFIVFLSCDPFDPKVDLLTIDT